MEATAVLRAKQFEHELLNDGVILEMYNRVTDMAIETSIKIPLTPTQTPRRFFLVVQKIGDCISNECRWVWRLEVAMA